MDNTQSLIDMFFTDTRRSEEYERNDEALLKLVEYAKSHPENWDQSEWVNIIHDGDEFQPGEQDELDVIVSNDGEPLCGTTMCLGGFQAHAFDRLSPHDMHQNGIGYADWAGWRLGLNHAEAMQLFGARNFYVLDVVTDIINNVYRQGE